MRPVFLSLFILFLIVSCTNFNTDKPDTRSNISGFKNIVDVPKTEDIKDIYFFADELGFEPLYQFSFTCKPSTIVNIINRHHLTKVQKRENDYYNGVGQQFKWWDRLHVDSLNLHWKRFDSTANNVKELWFDPKNSKGYFLSVQL